MKKLLFILLLLPFFSFGQQGGPTINQIQPNFQTGGVWRKFAPVISGSSTQVAAVGEPTVIYEASPQILTNASGSVFKMWFSGGDGNIWYAESFDGLTWIQSSTFVVASHIRSCVLKVSTTYYMYAANSAQTQIDQYTSSNGSTWTLANSSVIAIGGVGTWNHAHVANSSVIKDGSTWRMLLDGQASGGAVFTEGYYESTDGITWTQPFTNPVISNGGRLWGAPYLFKSGSTFYVWINGSPTSGALLPTDTYRFSSPDCQTWTIANSGNPVLSRTMADEGVATSVGQASDVCLVEVNGKTFMYYCGTPDGSAGVPTTQIKLAIANCTIANLVTTNEGEGGNINIKTISNPMTAVGQMIYGATGGIPTSLVPNNTTSKYFLTQTGNGSSSNAPSWFNLYGSANTWTAQNTFSVGSVGHLDITGNNNYLEQTDGTNILRRYVATNAGNFNAISLAGDVGIAAIGQTTNGNMLFGIENNNGGFKWTTWMGGTPSAGTSYLAATLTQKGYFGIGNQSAPTALFQVTEGTNGLGKITTTASSGAVVGTGTDFTQRFRIGQTITAASETHTITAITDDTHLTTDNWTNTNSTPIAYTLVGGTILQAYGNGNVQMQNGGFILKSFTVSTLPTGVTGMEAYVTDASSPSMGATVTGGGSAKAKVWYNGSNWTVTGI